MIPQKKISQLQKVCASRVDKWAIGRKGKLSNTYVNYTDKEISGYVYTVNSIPHSY